MTEHKMLRVRRLILNQVGAWGTVDDAGWVTVHDHHRCEDVSSRGQRCAIWKGHASEHYYADSYRPKGRCK